MMEKDGGSGRPVEGSSTATAGPSMTISAAWLQELMDSAVHAALPSFGNIIDQKIKEAMQTQGER